MALLLQNGAVFLHVPKTGGLFIRDVLRHLDLVRHDLGGHAVHDRVFWYDRFHRDEKVVRNLIRRRLGLIPRISPHAFRFCFVREPLTWYASFWRYMETRQWRHQGDEGTPYHWSPLEMLNGLGSSNFNEFVFNVNRRRPGYVTELFGWYARPSTHFIGKLENLQADLCRALNLTGVAVNLDFLRKLAPVNRVDDEVPYPEWDPSLRRTTLQLEYAGYVRYGYDVDPVEEASEFALP